MHFSNMPLPAGLAWPRLSGDVTVGPTAPMAHGSPVDDVLAPFCRWTDQPRTAEGRCAEPAQLGDVAWASAHDGLRVVALGELDAAAGQEVAYASGSRLAVHVRQVVVVGEGWLADRLCGRLGGECLVNLGGDLYARGSWPVGIGGTTVLLEDMGAATSSTRHRRWDDFHHLIDPRTGQPARSDLSEVSVAAGSGFEAEVHAKTALLLGREKAPAYLAANCLAWAYK